jgi:regulator of protease activity HflC (stomatin/prohibitin superfamily)
MPTIIVIVTKKESIMADITRAPFVRHLRAAGTSHIVQIRRGKQVRSGTGLSFWFRPLSVTVSEVPVDDRELPAVLHARTSDFQQVTAQATIGYRFADPEAVATRIDFSIDADRGTWRAEPLEHVARLLTESAQQRALDLVSGLPLGQAITEGGPALREHIEASLAADEWLRQSGIAVTGVRVTAVRAEPDLERALQTPARESVQQDADRATYERRAVAVERERAISENELQSKIELATREEGLFAQQGANTRRKAADAAEALRIQTEGEATRDRVRAAAQAEARRVIGEAEAVVQRASVDAYSTADPQVLLALALRELAGNLPGIGSLTITPDLLTSALGRFAADGRIATEEARP